MSSPRTRGNLAVVNSEDGYNLPAMADEELGSSFGWNDRVFFGYRNGMVFDYGEWESRDIETMLKRDYTGRQIESVISQPIISAEWTITASKGDSGEADWLNSYWQTDPLDGGCETTLDEIIDLNTSAYSYKRAYWELVYGTMPDGKIGYKNVAWRPQTTCRLAREVKTGKFGGFEQEPYYLAVGISQGMFPIFIPADKAYVYLANQRRDPLNGSSDLEIAYWCYKTKQKIMFLWFQFLEGVSLPRTIVTAQDIGTANEIARQVAQLKSSGVLPLANPGGQASTVQQLDVSGKGADQFTSAISWLDNAARNSVLAGFLNLTDRGMAMSGTGSFALSKDASDFYLQTEEARAREMARSLRKDLCAPLVRYNFGPKAAIPKFAFEPLNDIDKATAVSMLEAALAAPGNTAGIPPEFLAELAAQVSSYLGLDENKVRDAFNKAASDAAALAAANPTAAPGAPAVAGAAAATDVATQAVTGAQADQAGQKMSPAQSDALKVITG